MVIQNQSKAQSPGEHSQEQVLFLWHNDFPSVLSGTAYVTSTVYTENQIMCVTNSVSDRSCPEGPRRSRETKMWHRDDWENSCVLPSLFQK